MKGLVRKENRPYAGVRCANGAEPFAGVVMSYWGYLFHKSRSCVENDVLVPALKAKFGSLGSPDRFDVVLATLSLIPSVGLPVTGQPAIYVLFAKVQLQGIHRHSSSYIDPPPKVPTCVSSLTCPPITITTFAACRGKVLH
jgi:hypothetical protein